MTKEIVNLLKCGAVKGFLGLNYDIISFLVYVQWDYLPPGI